MKFRDFVNFPETAYSVHVSWTYLDIWLKENINELKLNLDPDFQRGHVWTEEQQKKFIEFIVSGGSSGLILYFNHQNWGRSFDGDFVLVDGKQRINAVLRFLNNEFSIFDNVFCKDFEDQNYLRNFHFQVHIASLKTKKEVLNWYLLMNAGGTPHSKEEIERVTKMLEEEESK